jgi:hypothetical protein
MAIQEKLTDPIQRKEIVRDAEQVLRAEVADKGGLSGVAIKATFRMVGGLKPGLIPMTIDALLDDFARQVDPFYKEWVGNSEGRSCRQHFISRGAAVADALLSITDDRAQHSDHRALVKAYKKLRPKGHQHVMAAMPRVGTLVEKYGDPEAN